MTAHSCESACENKRLFTERAFLIINCTFLPLLFGCLLASRFFELLDYKLHKVGFLVLEWKEYTTCTTVTVERVITLMW